MGMCVNKCKAINLPCNEYVEPIILNNPNKKPIKNISSSTTTNKEKSSISNNPKTINSISPEQFHTPAKKLSHNSLHLNEFDSLMLNEINNVRENPKEYSSKVDNLIPLIKNNSSNNKLFLIYDDIKIELKKGEEAFRECIHYLNNISMPLRPIELVEELSIPFPYDNIKLCLDRNYIGNCIEEIKRKTNNKYEIFDFQYDISPNPVLSTSIQVIDDTNSNYQRRNNILSENIKYIGISYGEIKKGIYCFYLLFAC